VVDSTATYGIPLSVEGYLESNVDTPEKLARLVELTPCLQLTLDDGHSTSQGIPDVAVEPLLTHARHVHCRGGAPGRLQTTFGDNTIDVRRMAERMKEVGYDGYIAIEYVWIDWQGCNSTENTCETILFRDLIRDTWAARIDSRPNGARPRRPTQGLDRKERMMEATGVGMEAARLGLDLLAAYRTMWLIRAFEDRVQDLFVQGEVSGTTHLCQGQEAVSVGVCMALRRDDYITCTYRGHGHVLAKGADPTRALAEIMGRATGLCRGLGGSMHLADAACSVLGSFAIIGAGIPIAAGAAWSARLRGTDQVAVAFFGDGTVNIGAFHEAANLAAVWRLPVLFVCENNLYGEYTPFAQTSPVAHVAERATAYAMASERVDGNDVETVFAAAARAVDRARRGDGPTLLECETYRQRGHSRTDPGTYRPRAEVEHWLARDPLILLRDRLAKAGQLADAADAQIQAEAQVRLDAAEQAARAAAPLPPEEVASYVYA